MEHRSTTELPPRPIERLTKPLEAFLHLQAAGGVVLLIATTLALVLANSGAAAGYKAFWDTHLTIGVGSANLDYPAWYWINDGLMAVFFFVIGLEVKRELAWGELSDKRNVTLPAVAALGGALVPIAIYLALNSAPAGKSLWATPMATDIAFVVGIMALFGSRLPAGFKVFMLSLAIIDDILAVIVIAAVFTAELAPLWLVGAGLGLAMVASLNRLGVRRIGVYVLVGAFVWLCTLKSGIHPTVAGAILGLMTPAAAWLTPGQLVDRMRSAFPRLEAVAVASAEVSAAAKTAPDPDYRDLIQQVDFTATESVSPLERIEHALHPWVGFVIMPLFALANAGVPVSLDGLGEPVSLSIALALFIGKPVGIVLASWLVVKTKLARLPSGVGWGMLTAGGSLAGIGFTMALFVASLSSEGATLEAAKAGILMGSLASMIVGSGLLYLATRNRAAPSA